MEDDAGRGNEARPGCRHRSWRTALIACIALCAVFASAYAQSGPVRVQVTAAGGTSIAKGLTRQLSASRYFFRGGAQPKNVTTAVRWSSSDPSTATVTPQGLVTAMNPGPATIKAVSGPFQSTLAMMVTPPALVSIDIFPLNANIAHNATQLFAASGHYSDGSNGNVAVSWNSSSPGVATISPGGLASAAAAGTTVIVATNGPAGISATAVLNVDLASHCCFDFCFLNQQLRWRPGAFAYEQLRQWKQPNRNFGPSLGEICLRGQCRQ